MITPQSIFLIGPKCSGKTVLAHKVCARTNTKYVNFHDFLKCNGLKNKDDETIVLAFIKHFMYEQAPRVLIEDFPQNETQAILFNRNCKNPSNVFVLECCKDECQQRMDLIDQTSAEFVCSGTLSQKIKEYNNNAQKLVPYLLKNTNCAKINAERTVESIICDFYKHLEPTIVHIRPGASSNDLRKQITDELSKTHGFCNLDINGLIRDENERKTDIGKEINKMVAGNKIIPAEMIVRILQKIIYSGDPTKTKFILSSFPDIIE